MSDIDYQETVHAKRARLSLLPRACDGCKTRKIRCDRSVPCSNCRMSGIACQKADAGPERKPRTERRTPLEEHFRILESRLRAVEDRLAGDQGPERSQQPSLHVDVSNNRPINSRSEEVPLNMYEGDSSFISQSVQAQELAKSMATSSGAEMRSNVGGTFDSLEGLLQPASKRETDYSRPTVATSLPLPADMVLAMLKSFQVRKPMFLWSSPMNDLSLVERLCQQAYFSTRATAPGDLAAMHGILYYTMKEYVAMKDPLCQRYNLAAHVETCKKAFLADLENLQILAVPTFENIIALTMGIIKAQDDANPLLCCHFISAAARHCQMLGFHRESTYQKWHTEDTDSKRRIFWVIYAFDKNMSLMLGRPSYMQDFDIDVPYPELSSDPAIRPWDEAFRFTIRISRIEGEIFNVLYSATAKKISHSERLARIEKLEVDLQKCHHGRQETDSSKVNNRAIFDMADRAWNVMYYSTLTTLLRASTTSGNEGEIGPKCFEAGRQSLRSYLSCFPDYSHSDMFSISDYANWVLLYPSFNPFIVVFLHAIAASNIDDVNLLDQVLQTLHHAKHASSASERLYKICSSFARVARGLVEARRSCVGQYNRRDDSLHFDPIQSSSAALSDTRQDFMGVDMMSYVDFPEAQDMSALLSSWDEGQPSAMDLFGLNYLSALSFIGGDP